MAIKITKATERDKREALSTALSNLSTKDRDSYCYLNDYDDSYVYYSEEIHEMNEYRSVDCKRSYTYDGVKAELGDDVKSVVRQTEYVEVPEEESLDKALSPEDISLFKKMVNIFSSKKLEVPVIKQFDDVEMISIEPLYISPDEVDLQGDTISREDTEGLVASLNKAIQEDTLQHGLFHKHKTDAYVLEKAWVNEVECTIGGNVVPEGKPIAKVRFNNKDAYQARKDQQLGSLSIGARATEVEILDE